MFDFYIVYISILSFVGRFTPILVYKQGEHKNNIYDIFIIHVLVYGSFSCNYNVDVHFYILTATTIIVLISKPSLRYSAS